MYTYIYASDIILVEYIYIYVYIPQIINLYINVRYICACLYVASASARLGLIVLTVHTHIVYMYTSVYVPTTGARPRKLMTKYISICCDRRTLYAFSRLNKDNA